MPTRRTAVAELRHRIASGRYPPGSRIPTRRELAADLGISSATLQLAFDRLVGQGFLVVRGKHGTFIAEHLPDRCRCALVFPEEPNEGGWNRYWSAVDREAAEWRDGQGRSFARYAIPDGSLDTGVHRALCADAADHGLAGLFFVTRPWYLERSPLLASGLPMVGVGLAEDPVGPAGSVLVLGDPWPGLMRLVAAQGRRRLAVIGSRAVLDDRRARTLAAQAGLETRPEWWLGLPVDPSHADCARNVAHLLFTLPAAARPDALIIADDNLVPHATAGIVAAGAAGAGILVLAHANFPHPTPEATPCRRYGFDIRDVLRTGLDELDRLRGGGAPRRVAIAPRLPD